MPLSFVFIQEEMAESNEKKKKWITSRLASDILLVPGIEPDEADKLAV
jgi:hypothetical protein